MAVVLAGVGVACGVPIVIGEQVVAQDAHVAYGQREALAKRRIARSGCIADEHDAVSIWMFYPMVGAVEGGERTGRVGICVKLGRNNRLPLPRGEAAPR